MAIHAYRTQRRADIPESAELTDIELTFLHDDETLEVYMPADFAFIRTEEGMALAATDREQVLVYDGHCFFREGWLKGHGDKVFDFGGLLRVIENYHEALRRGIPERVGFVADATPVLHRRLDS